MEKSYPQADGAADEPRVLCECCEMVQPEQRVWNFTAETFEKFRRINEQPGHWMFKQVKIRNGWARVEFSEDMCSATQLPCMPSGVRHHCNHYRPARPAADGDQADQDGIWATTTAATKEAVKSDAWWE